MAQTLETNIVINATVGNGFSEIGNTLTQLGAQIDVMSQKLIGFGKDSLNVYQDYEKNMAEARVALSTIYGRSTKELNDVMAQLEVAATEWAGHTIFHTDDVSNAITEAARAGWDYSMIMQGIPVAMELAQAGSIDLSDALYYITESAKAGGIAFEDLGTFVDMWAYAANSSNGSIESFGDTMLRLGSVMQFADSREELLALIAVMHDTGTEGSTAATLLRTAMMNILAPSGTAGTVLEQLGATEEEIESIRQDASKIEALNILEEYGFSAFDDQGQAKPILEIFDGLGAALAEIAGGYENIDKNETTLGVLGTIFGKRGITGALNIINMMDHAVELRDELQNGNAEGYGEYAAETMMDTLYGAVETWESKVEKLEQRTGEALSAQLQPVLETLGGIVDSISGLDTGTFNALIACAETLAVAGPGLLLAGGAFRFIGNSLATFTKYPVLGQTAAIALAVIGVNQLLYAMQAFEEADYAAEFGNMELDPSAIQNYVQTIQADFEAANAQITTFNQELSAAVTAYSTAGSNLKSGLLTAMLTDAEIPEGSDTYNKFVAMGETMCTAVQEGVSNNYAATMASVLQTFGGEEEAAESPLWAEIQTMLEQGFQNDIDRANSLSTELRNAITSAFEDGHLTSEEISKIQSVMDEMNQLLAEQLEIENYAEQQRILRKAQTLGLDSTFELVSGIKDVNDNNLETMQTQHDKDYKRLEIEYGKRVESGEITQEEADTELSTFRDKQLAMENELTAKGENLIYETLESLITGSDLSNAWFAAQGLASEYLANGGAVSQEAINAYSEQAPGTDSARLGRYIGEMVDYLGGIERISGYADYFEDLGDSDTAGKYRNILALYDLIGGGQDAWSVGMPTAGLQEAPSYVPQQDNDADQINALLRGAYGADTSESVETLAEYVRMQNQTGMPADWEGFLGNDQLYRQLLSLAEERNTDINGLIASNAQTSTVYEPAPVTPMAIEPRVDESQDAISSLSEQGVRVNVWGDTTELQATIDGEDGQNLMTYINGDATNLNATIESADGKHITTIVDGDTSQVRAALDNLRNQVVRVTLVTNTVNLGGGTPDKYAEGGRAEEPSIFAEGNTAEWAIPEEHSPRTADLLTAAANASGFTWPELIDRNGGMNANPEHVPTTLVYSPTINARDADGVEEVLLDDKKRLDKWYQEKTMRDEAEVYA